MKLYNQQDVISGIFIYALGDSIATLLLGNFSVLRLLGMMLIGGAVYALEIPHYFRWIDRKTEKIASPFSKATAKTTFALLYFNPLWIARHLFFIKILSKQFEQISWGIMHLGFLSWLGNIPLSIVGNYVIQVKMPLKWRFAASAAFSGLMAIYYALSETIFK